MATINNIDVLAAIQSYLENHNRPCPAHYLMDKFGDDVVENVNELKKDGKVIGRRGRNGGIVFPDTVFKDKSPIAAKRVDTSTDDDSDNTSDAEIVDLPI